MNIWILKNGQKDGPHHDFEIRSMINNDDVTPDVAAWHEGMEKWLPLGEIPLFMDSFKKEEEPLEDDEISDTFSSEVIPATVEAPSVEATSNTGPRRHTPEGEYIPSLRDGQRGVFLWRRFFARFIDFYILSATLCLLAIFNGQNPFDINSTINNQLFIILFIFLYDLILSHVFGSTIGKALLGLRVESAFDGQNIGLTRGILRSLAVSFIIPLGANVILGPIFLVFCIFFAKKRFMLPWDTYGASAVRGLPLTTARIIGAVMIFICITLMVQFFTPPQLLEELQQQLQQRMEN